MPVCYGKSMNIKISQTTEAQLPTDEAYPFWMYQASAQVPQ